jgi:hypothetical protein
VFGTSTIRSSARQAPKAADGRERWPAAALLTVLRRLSRARREPGRPEDALPIDRDRGRFLSVFFPFDVRDLIGDGQAEERGNRR